MNKKLCWTLAAVVTLLSACGAPNEADQLTRARESLKKRDEQTAIIHLKSVLQQNANSGEARYLLGKALLQAGDGNGAVSALQKAREQHYADDIVLPLLAKSMLAVNQIRQVIDSFSNVALSNAKDTAELKAMVASAYLLQGSVDLAAQTTDAALALDAGNIAARLLRARLTAAKGDVQGAMSLVSGVLRDSPNEIPALLLLGELAWIGSGDGKSGAESFRKIIAIDPRNMTAYSHLIRIAMQQDDTEGVRQQVAALKKVFPNAYLTSLYDIQLSFLDGDLKKAKEGVYPLLKRAPNVPQVLQLAGAIELRSGALVLAESHLTKAVQALPDAVPSRRLLAETYLRLGQSTKALDTLAPLLKMSDPAAQILALAGEAYLLNGDLEKSEFYYSSAAKKDPADPRIRTALALSQLAIGNTEAGFSQLESFAVSDKTTYADMALIGARLRTGDTTAALSAVDRLQGKLKEKSLAHLLRGRILVAQKKYSDGRLSFENALKERPFYFPAVVELGRLDVMERKPDEAIKRFEAQLAQEPRNAKAMMAIAQLKQAARAPAGDVMAMLEAAVKASPGESAPRLAMIEFALGQRETKLALARAQEALAAFPDEVAVQDTLGRAQLAAGDIEQAITTFRKMSGAEPKAILPLMRLADAYVVRRDYLNAKANLQKALEISPNLISAQRALIRIAMTNKRPDEALQIARGVQKKRPKDPAGFAMEGEVHSAVRRWDLAIEPFRLAFERDPSGQSAARLHAAYLNAGRASDAERFSTAWERDHPKDEAFFVHLGSALMERKQYAAAEIRFRQAESLSAGNASTLNNIAWLMLQQGKPGAVPFAERANQAEPNQPQIMDTLASALAAEKKFELAIKWQRQALAAAGNNPQYRLNLAKFLAAAGERDQARAELKELSALGDKFADQDTVASLLKSL